MMDSGKYFTRSEKHDLIETFKGDTDSKEVKEAKSSTNFSRHDVFEESLDSSTCRSNLLHCLKRLKSKMTYKYTKTNTVKGKSDQSRN